MKKQITLTPEEFDEAVHKVMDASIKSHKEKELNPMMVLFSGIIIADTCGDLRNILFADDETNSQEEALREQISGSRD